MSTATITASVSELRTKYYNATVREIDWANPELMILRVAPDGGVPGYEPGQYSTLGLGYWEPRAPECQPEDLKPDQETKLIKRAYSISSSMLDASGRLLSAQQPYLEFYIVLVRSSDHGAPALTPRLFQLRPGARVFLGPKVTGHYTLEPVQDGQDVLFMATGTGEAPHNAMLAELLRRNHRGLLASIVCVRYRRDLAYLAVHEELQRRYPQYRYFALTTREPENLDPKHPNYVGKQYIQELLETGELEKQLGKTLPPETTHVFLCGNPSMIGIPEIAKDGRRTYPETTGVVEILERRGFRCDERGRVGNVHFEKYW